MEHKCPNGHWKGDKEKDLPSGKCNACGADLVEAGEPKMVKEPATIAAEAMLAAETSTADKFVDEVTEPRLSRKQQRAKDREDAAQDKNDYSSFTTGQGDDYASKEEGEGAGVFKEVKSDEV